MTVAADQKETKKQEFDLCDALADALQLEFPKLANLHRLDLRPVNEINGRIHFRVNAWKVDDSTTVSSGSIVFSKYVIAWKEDDGLKYKIIG